MKQVKYPGYATKLSWWSRLMMWLWAVRHPFRYKGAIARLKADQAMLDLLYNMAVNQRTKAELPPLTLKKMTRAEFLKSIETTYADGIKLIQKKNQDYAGESDPFQNFRGASVIGLSVEKAILIRVLDKITRVANLLDRNNVVLDESLTDSLLDAINYLAILKAYRESK